MLIFFFRSSEAMSTNFEAEIPFQKVLRVEGLENKQGEYQVNKKWSVWHIDGSSIYFNFSFNDIYYFLHFVAPYQHIN